VWVNAEKRRLTQIDADGTQMGHRLTQMSHRLTRNNTEMGMHRECPERAANEPATKMVVATRVTPPIASGLSAFVLRKSQMTSSC